MTKGSSQPMTDPDPSPDGELRALRDKLDHLEARGAIESVLRAYCTLMDEGGDASRVFTVDAGVRVTAIDGATVRQEEGIEEIQRSVDGRQMPPSRWHLAVPSTIEVDHAAGIATSSSTWMTLEDGDDGARVGFGRYTDTLARTAGGWRLRSRHIQAFSTPPVAQAGPS